MEAYTAFSNLYERFMADAPYGEWTDWVRARFPDVNGMHLLDLGCGTGTLTRQLAAMGAVATGIDLSADMLGIAMQEGLAERLKITWLCQDMKDFRVSHPQDLILSTCDALNYLPDETAVEAAFARVWQALVPDGWFCFDVVGAARLQRLRDEGIFYDLRDDAAALFETSVNGHGVIHYEVTAFVMQENGLYKRISEEHQQTYYEPEWICDALSSLGFIVREIQGDFGKTHSSNADRVLISATKPA